MLDKRYFFNDENSLKCLTLGRYSRHHSSTTRSAATVLQRGSSWRKQSVQTSTRAAFQQQQRRQPGKYHQLIQPVRFERQPAAEHSTLHVVARSTCCTHAGALESVRRGVYANR